MKRILLILTVLTVCSVASAQQDKVDKANAALEKAVAESQDAKKSSKTATWVKLAQSYLKLYDTELGNGAQFLGDGSVEVVKIALEDDPVMSEENVVVAGVNLVKKCYATHNYYYDSNGVIRIVEISKTVCPEALDKAFESYGKAYELDVKGQKTKDIVNGYIMLNSKYRTEAENAFNFGNYPLSAEKFIKSASALESAPLCKIDTFSVYNAAFVSMRAKEYANAKKYYLRCCELGFCDEGNVYSQLAEICGTEGDTAGQLKYLEEGFQLYPKCQNVLYGLINFYRNNNLDTSRLFELLNQAKEQEPENPSIYVVEGDIHEKLGEIDAASESYNKAIEVNPEFPGGYIGLGFMYFNQASEISNRMMSEYEEEDINRMTEQIKDNLRACIPPLEKVVELSPENKENALKGLKAACFQLRLDDPVYMEKFNLYKQMYDEIAPAE